MADSGFDYVESAGQEERQVAEDDGFDQ